MIRILLVDDQLLQIKALTRKLHNNEQIVVVGTSTDGATALALVEETHPDIVVLDIKMPGFSGLQVAEQIKASTPQVKILMLSGSIAEVDIRKAIEIGVEGYLMKDMQENELVDAINIVYNNGRYIPSSLSKLSEKGSSSIDSQWAQGKLLIIGGKQVYITRTELNILHLIVIGNSHKDIASSYNTTEEQVKNAVNEIVQKLELKRPNELAVFAIQHNLFE